MNKHFNDARYYLGRAAEHLKAGIKEELTPIVRRVRRRVNGEIDEDVDMAQPETPKERARVAARRSKARVEQGVSTARDRARQLRERNRPSA